MSRPDDVHASPPSRRNVLRRGKTVLRKTGFAVKKSISVGEGLRWRTRFAFDDSASQDSATSPRGGKLGELKKSKTMDLPKPDDQPCSSSPTESNQTTSRPKSTASKSVTIRDQVEEITDSPAPSYSQDTTISSPPVGNISDTTPEDEIQPKRDPSDNTVASPESLDNKFNELNIASANSSSTNDPSINTATTNGVDPALRPDREGDFTSTKNENNDSNDSTLRSSYRKYSVGSEPLSDDGGVAYNARMTRISRTGIVERSVAAAVFTAARQRSLAKKPKPRTTAPRPPHHTPGGGFVNPWDSAMRENGARYKPGQGSRTFFHKVAKDKRPPDEQLAGLLLLAARPDFNAGLKALESDKYALASHWIGHSSFLMQTRGLTLLTDPVWNSRLGPLGPKRLVPPACEIEHLPEEIDAVVLSNACYDSYDKMAIQQLAPRVKAWLVPLGMRHLLVGNGVKDTSIVELDWWQQHRINGTLFVCTPAQHHSVREESLWCSWTIHAPHHRIFFCGGTGYRSVHRDSEDYASYDYRNEYHAPTCPVFKEIYRRYGSVDTAFLPIGGFSPRQQMSSVQGDPVDMLFIHRDLRAKRSVGHRWGTFSTADEGLLEPVRVLEAAILSSPISETEFSYVRHGRLHVT